MRTPSIRLTRFGLMMSCLVCLLFSAAVVAWAQTRQAGLWETTTMMSWQKSPMPNGALPPGTMGGSHTSEVCLTQAMIDKFGAPMPLARQDCTIVNVKKGEHEMTAELTCIGRMNGKGTIEASWEDPFHAKSKVHFTGTVENGPNSRPIEWTSSSTSIYKRSNCGAVKPIEPTSK